MISLYLTCNLLIVRKLRNDIAIIFELLKKVRITGKKSPLPPLLASIIGLKFICNL